MTVRRGVAHERPHDGRPRGPGQGRMPLAHLARFREATYGLLSEAFQYPDEGRLRALTPVARELGREGGALVRFAFFARWSQLVRTLEELGQRDVEETQRQYVSLFVVSAGGLPCPPYESVYRGTSREPTGWLLAQVEREYAAAGLAPSPDLGELPDHLAVEMGFLTVLCGREAQAWEKRDPAGGVDALRRQKAFLDAHLALWLPEFARHVAAADSLGIYAALSDGAQTFMSYDRDLLGAFLDSPPLVDEASQASTAVPEVHAKASL